MTEPTTPTPETGDATPGATAKKPRVRRTGTSMLHPYQVRGVEWIRETTARLGSALLGDAMGVGKSPQFIVAPPSDAGVIVVVPAVLKLQTAERIVAWRGIGTRVRILDGLGGFAPPRPGEWFVLNPELLPAAGAEERRARREIGEGSDGGLDFARTERAAAATKRLARIESRGVLDRDAIEPGTWLIVDECDEYATYGSAQTERLRALVAAVLWRKGRVLGVTATPLRNDPADLRTLLATFRLGGAAWPASKGRALDYWSYMRSWGGSKGIFGEEWSGEPRDAEIADALRRVMLRRSLRSVVELPPMLPTQRVTVDIDATVRELADHGDEMIRRRSQETRGGEKIVFEECAKVRAALAVAKLPAAHAWCAAMESAGEPAVVACVSADVVRDIATRPGWGRIMGPDSAESRAETVRAFARGELRGVALTHAAGGVGIDLQTAARMLIVSREWNPTRNRQTLARILRQGQTRPVGLTMLYAAHPIEERLDELLATRKRWMEAIDAAEVAA